MNIKKKLFMLSLGGFMIVPSNLALVSSVTTSVLAEDNSNDMGENSIWLTSGTYTLIDDSTLKKTDGTIQELNFNSFFEVEGEVVIDLNGYTITSEADTVFNIMFGGTLTLMGDGKVECISTKANSAVVMCGQMYSPSKSTMYVKDRVTLEAKNGLGIYQIGNSEVNLTDDCVIKGRTGIEVRSGNLFVSGGTITATSKDLKVREETDGSMEWIGYTTYGAAIAVAPQASNPFVDVDIKGATLEGKAGLVLIDPEKALTVDYEVPMRDVKLKVVNTSFASTNTYNIGYDSNMENFLDGIESTISKINWLYYKTEEDGDSGKGDLLDNTISIEDDDTSIILSPESFFYAGKELKPKVIVKYEDEYEKKEITLNLNEDYILEYENNTNVGTATVIVKGIKKYSGEVEKKFEITPAHLSNDSIRFTSSDPYFLVDGKCEPEIEVRVKDMPLVPETDYTVEYSVTSTQDSGIVKVTGKGNYTGIVSKTFSIKSENNSGPTENDNSQTPSTSEPPTVKNITPNNVTLDSGSYILDNGKPLVKGTDYEVTYANSNKIGTATVTVTGKGNYEGTISKNYTIKGKTFALEDIKLASGPYTISKDNLKPEITVTGVSADNYEVTYTLPTDKDGKVMAGEATVTVIGQGDYAGCEQSKTYLISDDRGGSTSGSSSHKPVTKPKPTPEEPARPIETTTLYRLYNHLTGEHLYIIDKAEKDSLLTSDTWKEEGEGWTVPSVSNYPIYRLLNPNTGDHHYTTDKNEFDTLPSLGWTPEGIAFYSADKDNPENEVFHRLYNPNATGIGMHHYTADTNERDTLESQSWIFEGTAWAGLPANK